MTNKEIVAAVRKGLSFSNLVEAGDTYLTIRSFVGTQPAVYQGCFWGVAFAGTFNTADEAYQYNIANRGDFESGPKPWEIMMERLGVNEEYFNKVEEFHKKGHPAIQIAGWLDSGQI